MTILNSEPEWATKDDMATYAKRPTYGVYHLLCDGERYGVLGHSPLEMCCLCVPARANTFVCPVETLPEPMAWSEAARHIEEWRGRDPGCEIYPEHVARGAIIRAGTEVVL